MLANILSLHLFSYLRPGSNRHVHNGHRILSPARLPIPPLRHLFRAENETRTRDPDLGKVVLYQLSYFRKNFVFAASCRDSALLKHAWHCARCSKKSAWNDGFYLKLRCKDTAFFNMANVFLKNFYLEYNLLIIKFLVINFEGLQLSKKDGSRKMMTKNQ